MLDLAVLEQMANADAYARLRLSIGTRRRIWSVNLATKQIYIEALNGGEKR